MLTNRNSLVAGMLAVTLLTLPVLSRADTITAPVLPDPHFFGVEMIIVNTTSPFHILGIDTKGNAAVAVLDDGIPVESTATFIGNVLPSPFGNSILFGLNLPTVTEADKANLFYGGLQVTGDDASVPAIFTQKSATLTDLALEDLLGPAVFDFSFTSSSVVKGDNVSVWTLTEIEHTGTLRGAVPEPSTAVFLASALIGIALLRRYRARPN